MNIKIKVLLNLLLVSTQFGICYGETKEIDTVFEEVTGYSKNTEIALGLTTFAFGLPATSKVIVGGLVTFSDDYEYIKRLETELDKKNRAINKMYKARNIFQAQEVINKKGIAIIDANLIGAKKSRDVLKDLLSDQKIVFKNYTEASILSSVKKLSLEDVKANHKDAVKTARKIARRTFALSLIIGSDLAIAYILELSDEADLDESLLDLLKETLDQVISYNDEELDTGF